LGGKCYSRYQRADRTLSPELRTRETELHDDDPSCRQSGFTTAHCRLSHHRWPDQYAPVPWRNSWRGADANRRTSTLLSFPTITRVRLVQYDALMEKRESYTRISELLAPRRAQGVATSDSQGAIVLIEQIFRFVDDMAMEERDALMKRLTCWAVARKFGSDKVPALKGLHRYCVATSVTQYPLWDPPKLRL
jgi:hypothetical protein